MAYEKADDKVLRSTNNTVVKNYNVIKMERKLSNFRVQIRELAVLLDEAKKVGCTITVSDADITTIKGL